jgi:hypothetical protein
MKRALICAASAAALTFATTASADPFRLKGSYAVTGSNVCLIAPGSSATPANPTPGTALPNSGFNTSCGPGPGCQDLRPIDGKVFSFSSSIEGIVTFNGDGTGSVKRTEIGTTVPPTPGPAGTYPAFPPSAETDILTYNFAYTVDDSGGWTSDSVPGTISGTHIRGPRTGQTFTVDRFATGTGLIGEGGKTLISADVDPTGHAVTVETVSHSNGDVWPQICHRSRVLIRLPDRDRGDDDHRD